MFNSARIKLTAWYLLIVMVISLSFSLAIYNASKLEIERFDRLQRSRIERRLRESLFLPPPFIDSSLIEETKNRIKLNLLVINGGILFLAGITGYFLAGRTLQPIKEMVEEQNRFISDASHELRTPLTSLKSAIEVHLRSPKISAQQTKVLLSENLEEIKKMQTLADNLLQLAQYQKPPTNVNLTPVSIKDITKEALRRIEPLAREKGIKIMTEITDITLKGQRESLIDLLVIFLDNAIKYSLIKKEVELTSNQKDNWLILTVKDQGMGISEKDLPHIFDRFYRSDHARTKKTAGGYGLGLAIAKKIVVNHHGTISAESKINQGSIFTVKLPLFS